MKTQTVNCQKRCSGKNLLIFVGVSFGLLCVLQAGLNVYLRLAFWYHTDMELSITKELLNHTTADREQLRKKLSTYIEYFNKGWVNFGQSMYFISSRKKSWQESRHYCLQRGADLVIINSKEEQEFTRNLHKRAWIGLTETETEGEWKWVDGTLLNISFWGPDEPNNYHNLSEDCAEIRFLEYQNSWNDVTCETENIWICEKNVTL